MKLKSLGLFPLLSFALIILLGKTNLVLASPDETYPGKAQIDWIISVQDPISGLVDSFQNDGKANAYIFDQALAIIALTSANKITEANNILNRMRGYQRDEPNGAWYVAYKVGEINSNDSPEDCNYYRTGDIAWMVIAINFYECKTRDHNYAPVAKRALGWMDTMMYIDDQNDNRYGSLKYSNRNPEIISTEHNIDSYSAYYWRGMLDANDSNLHYASLILNYLRREMWAPSSNSNCCRDVNVFWQGYSDWSLATDCQAWAVLSLGPRGSDDEEFYKTLDLLLFNPFGTTRNIQDYNDINDVDGFRVWTGIREICDPNIWGRYSEDLNHIWVDGTEHVAAAFYSIGDDANGDYFHNQMGRIISPNGGLIHSFCEIDPNTPSWPENHRYNYVASTAWYYFNEARINPFNLRPCFAECRAANINKEGMVDFIDYATLALDWLETSSDPYLTGDINRDGRVHRVDLDILTEYWLKDCNE